MNPQTNPTTDAKLTAAPTPAVTLALRAHRLKDGTSETFVTTTEGKTAVRGMTVVHANFEAAKAQIEADAVKAEKLGWTRRVAGRGFVAKPDAFKTLPPAPKPTKK